MGAEREPQEDFHCTMTEANTALILQLKIKKNYKGLGWDRVGSVIGHLHFLIGLSQKQFSPSPFYNLE